MTQLTVDTFVAHMLDGIIIEMTIPQGWDEATLLVPSPISYRNVHTMPKDDAFKVMDALTLMYLPELWIDPLMQDTCK